MKRAGTLPVPRAACLVVGLLVGACRSTGESGRLPAASETPADPAARRLPNLPWPTMGGTQLWADLFVYGGFRIQENVYTGHCRLLDPEDVRRAWGSYPSCRAAFEEARREKGIRVRSRHAVVLLHGLLRSRASLSKLAEAIAEAGYEPICAAYPSTRRGIAEHAERLERLLDSLEDAEEVSFVTHSLGAMVVRGALARPGAWRERLPVRRLVMIAPPSRGSAMARALKELPFFQWMAGPSGLEVGEEDLPALPSPACSFGVIAGGQGNGWGLNPFLSGDDDGVVAVEETKLEGAQDFLLVRAEHTFIMNDPAVIAATISFLKTGKFCRADLREEA